MSIVISPLFTFPPISWWATVIDADKVIFDTGERFRKMSFRNRYMIPGANNAILLTVPLAKGRSQHCPVCEVMIWNQELWQVRHWRTLISVYKRTPYFEYYENSLSELFENEYARLADFNIASINWVKTWLAAKFTVREKKDEMVVFDDDTMDIRMRSFTHKKVETGNFPKYYQVFEDRIGFKPDMSILDLLFSEGNQTAGWLRKNKELIIPA